MAPPVAFAKALDMGPANQFHLQQGTERRNKAAEIFGITQERRITSIQIDIAGFSPPSQCTHGKKEASTYINVSTYYKVTTHRKQHSHLPVFSIITQHAEILINFRPQHP